MAKRCTRICYESIRKHPQNMSLPAELGKLVNPSSTKISPLTGLELACSHRVIIQCFMP